MRPRFWRPYRWQSLEMPGFELMEMSDGARHVDLRGMLVTEAEGVALGAAYHIRLGADWVFHGLNLQMLDGRTLKLRSDGKGGWTEGDGAPRPDLADCIDIDLSGSPVTNSLPINRARMTAGESETFTMAYIDLVSLDVSPCQQEYLKRDATSYRYCSVDSGFVAELTTDSDGIVTTYPGLFQLMET
ncbi:MAG: putative glycolipid-binding domain-containing protein [Alphaproteobacteria bacterium]|nr:putative glycolipid-binding domain-containing protein [Alphaproteobacteria bacterium]